MQRILILFFFATITILSSSCNQNKSTYAIIKTDHGDMKVLLYNSTPGHRDNFVKLAKEGFYDGTIFHRVIRGFMIQGGDPDTKNAAPGRAYGSGGPGYQIPHEIGAYHFKGALSAARTANPEKKSSGSQFYLVQGSPVTDAMLDQIESRTGIKYTVAERSLYKELGGTPNLDNEYTVYGEVVEGMEVIDKIASQPTERSLGDRPLTDVPMKVTIQ